MNQLSDNLQRTSSAEDRESGLNYITNTQFIEAREFSMLGGNVFHNHQMV